MKRQVIPERYRVAKLAINTKYKITDLAKEVGIPITENGQRICCPFHDDSTPSFSIDSERNIYNCFGCGRGGTYIDFFKDVMEKFKDIKLSYYESTQRLLDSDSELRAACGFSSIFETYEDSFNFISDDGEVDESLLCLDKPRLLDREITMKHLMDKLTREDITIKMAFIADCERNMSAQYLIDKYWYGNYEEVKHFSPDRDKEFTSLFADAMNIEE